MVRGWTNDCRSKITFRLSCSASLRIKSFKSLLHVRLRRVEAGATKMELILHIRGVGGDRQRKLLRGFLPLLVRFVAHALLEILVALFGEGRRGQQQQAGGKQQGNQSAGFCL